MRDTDLFCPKITASNGSIGEIINLSIQRFKNFQIGSHVTVTQLRHKNRHNNGRKI